MLTRQQVAEIVERAIAATINKHGYIDEADLADVLTDLVDDLRERTSAEPPPIDAE